MNNRLSYCGLVDAKIRASDKDLPVHKPQNLGHNPGEGGPPSQTKTMQNTSDCPD